VAPQVRIRAQGSQDVVGAAHQEVPQHLVAFLGDAFWGGLSPERSVAGTSPSYAPTERLLSKQWGSSKVSTKVSAVIGPMPSTSRKSSVSG
jgi:hypothetical protein